jgi:hypothetical protein
MLSSTDLTLPTLTIEGELLRDATMHVNPTNDQALVRLLLQNIELRVVYGWGESAQYNAKLAADKLRKGAKIKAISTRWAAHTGFVVAILNASALN